MAAITVLTFLKYYAIIYIESEEENMECTVINAVEELFNKAGISIKEMWRYSPDYDALKIYCLENDITFCAGATKIVFPELFGDIVVKIPLVGAYRNWNGCKLKEEDKYERYCDDNHLETEVGYYSDYIKNSTLEDLFIETEYVGQINNMKIYIQEKTVPFEQTDFPVLSDDTYASAEESEFYDVVGDDIETICAFYAEFGINKGDEILQELENWGLRDIHQGNIGYLNGKLKIYDYGGFNP